MNNECEKFFKNYYQIIEGINICIDNKLVLPSLTLIYCGIDSLAWIAYGDKTPKVQDRFTNWVKNHMYIENKLPPKPIDLYAARCAILHTLTPVSDLSKNKKAKTICYAWGNGDTDKLKKSIELSSIKNTTYIHLNDLFDNFKKGMMHFLESDYDMKNRVKRMNQHYSNRDTSTIDKFIENHK